MRIGTVAEQLGLTTSAIRFYERKGLIPPVGRVGSTREFDTRTILTLRFLKMAQKAGFTLSEAKTLLEIGFGPARPQSDWSGFLTRKREMIRQQMLELQRMDMMLAQIETCTCPSLEQCMSHPDCMPVERRVE